MDEFVIQDGLLVSYNGDGGDVVIPDGVTALRSYVFCCRPTLRSVVIPKSVRTIGGEAFAGCEALSSVTFSVGLHTIGMWAFRHCTSLETLSLPEGLRVIGRHAFEGCTSLTAVDLPDSARDIHGAPFGQCAALTELRADGKLPKEIWKSIDKVQYCANRLQKGLPLSNREKRFSSFFFREIAETLLAAQDVLALQTLFAMRKAVRRDWLEEWIARSGDTVAVRAVLMDYRHRVYAPR